MTANALSYTNHNSATLNLNDGSTYKLRDTPQGIYTLVGSPLLQNIPVSLPPAMYDGHLYKPRIITIPLYVFGATASALTSNIRALAAELWPDLRGRERGTLAYTSWDGVARSIRAVLDPQTDFKSIVAMSVGKAMATIDLKFICPDPTFYDAASATASGAFSGDTPVNIACANAGDVDAYPVITYTQPGAGTTVNPQVTDAYGHVWKVEKTIETSKVLVLTFDPQALSMTYDGSTDWLGYESTDSRLIVCKYGTNNLTFVCDAGGDAAISISFYSRYSTHG